MKIFVVGMPQSGRTTVSKALCELKDFQYIDAVSWVKSNFREQKQGEHPQQYADEYHTWYTNRMKVKPRFISDNVYDCIDAYGQFAEDAYTFVVDGISSPRDLMQLFDYNKDMIVFLNRTNNSADYKDYENIGVSVMRDYCFWLASADLLPKERWLEYNFAIPGDESDWVKQLGQKNSVFLVKNINKVISHLKEQLIK
jgi:adenylate kinase family enzyme